jgi:hypothetical protein
METTIASKIKCSCPCHRNKGIKHVIPCCENGYIEIPKQKVIQFDLPKGYTARDAYETALWWLNPDEIMTEPKVSFQETLDHFYEEWEYWNSLSIANFYLLLAYANGFKD